MMVFFFLSKALAHILYKEQGLVDPFQVERILGVSQEDAARYTASVTSSAITREQGMWNK